MGKRVLLAISALYLAAFGFLCAMALEHVYASRRHAARVARDDEMFRERNAYRVEWEKSIVAAEARWAARLRTVDDALVRGHVDVPVRARVTEVGDASPRSGEVEPPPISVTGRRVQGLTGPMEAPAKR